MPIYTGSKGVEGHPQCEALLHSQGPCEREIKVGVLLQAYSFLSV